MGVKVSQTDYHLATIPSAHQTRSSLEAVDMGYPPTQLQTQAAQPLHYFITPPTWGVNTGIISSFCFWGKLKPREGKQAAQDHQLLEAESGHARPDWCLGLLPKTP